VLGWPTRKGRCRIRVIVAAALSALVLSGCIAELKPSDKAPQRTALEGFPGVSCEAGERMRPGMHLPGQPLCLNQSQWAARDRQFQDGVYNPAPLYPNHSSAQVANSGSPYPGQSKPF